VATFGSLASDVVNGRASLGSDVITIADDRINLITTFANVVAETPSAVPYWGGHTYYPLLTKLIPRMLYPNKPADDASQSFPHRYGFLADTDVTTSYKFAQLVEAYANFGAGGVVIVMFLIGTIYRVTQEVFVHPSAGLGALIAGTYLLTQYFDIEANASLIFGGIPYTLIFVGIVCTLTRLIDASSTEDILDMEA